MSTTKRLSQQLRQDGLSVVSALPKHETSTIPAVTPSVASWLLRHAGELADAGFHPRYRKSAMGYNVTL